MELSTCPNCGARRLGAFRFCRECQYDYEQGGGSVPEPAAPPPAAPPPAAPEPAALEPAALGSMWAPTPKPSFSPPPADPGPPAVGSLPSSGGRRRRAIAVILGLGLLVIVLVGLNLGNLGGDRTLNGSPGPSAGASTGSSASPTSLIAPTPDLSADPTPTLAPTEVFSIREPADGSFAAATVVVRGTGPAGATVTARGEIGDPVTAKIGKDFLWELEVPLKPGANRLSFELSTAPGIQLGLTVTREESGA